VKKELGHNKAIMRLGSTTSSKKISHSGCNGPRIGIETHPQGLKCWTCGETVDARECTKFPYYSANNQNGEEASVNQDLDSNGNGHFMSANKPVITYPNEWSKECLKNEKYCVVQLITDQYGNNRE
jgi:hypothetical protein